MLYTDDDSMATLTTVSLKGIGAFGATSDPCLQFDGEITFRQFDANGKSTKDTSIAICP
jgi:hypothetical protein